MKTIPAALVHKVIAPRLVSAGKAPALVLLHGRGANEDDLLGLAEYLDERLMIVSARAPFAWTHGGGFTWYDVVDIGVPEPAMFTESYRKLEQFMADIRTGYAIDERRILLGGFSMGTVMSFALALSCPGSFLGVAAHSGLIPEATGLPYVWEEVRGKPFFVAHGVHDPVIPVAFARRAKELLTKAHAAVTYREYDLQHQIGEESLNDMMKWVSDLLDHQR